MEVMLYNSRTANSSFDSLKEALSWGILSDTDKKSNFGITRENPLTWGNGEMPKYLYDSIHHAEKVILVFDQDNYCAEFRIVKPVISFGFDERDKVYLLSKDAFGKITIDTIRDVQVLYIYCKPTDGVFDLHFNNTFKKAVYDKIGEINNEPHLCALLCQHVMTIQNMETVVADIKTAEYVFINATVDTLSVITSLTPYMKNAKRVYCATNFVPTIK